MFGETVFGIKGFGDILDKAKVELGKKEDQDITAEEWKDIIVDYKDLFARKANMEFPQAAHDQLLLATGAIFKSDTSRRALDYRRINKLELAKTRTAVTIQSMVFGNINDQSGTGVLFTRNPSTEPPLNRLAEPLVPSNVPPSNERLCNNLSVTTAIPNGAAVPPPPTDVFPVLPES